MKFIIPTMKSRLLSVMLGCAVAGSAPVQAMDYEFRTVVDDRGPFTHLCCDSRPAINDYGKVAFVGSGNHPTAGPFEGVFSKDDSTFTLILGHPFDIGDSPGDFRSVSINERGTVAFRASDPAFGDVIYAGHGGPLEVIAEENAFSAVGPPTINNRGQVAFDALRSTEAYGSKRGVFASSGGPPATIAEADAVLGGFFPPSFNDQGTAAFLGVQLSGNTAIFTGNGGPLSPVIVGNGALGLSDLPVINNRGKLAVRTTDGAGTMDIRIGDAVSAPAIIDTNGPVSSFGEYLSLNDKDAIAFIARLDFGNDGIYTGTSLGVHKVIAVGERLNGGEIFDLVIGREALNNTGQITFWALLGDGDLHETIFVATPKGDPADAGKMRTINGTVHVGDTPVCALILANGGHMFSCGEDGAYELTVPLDENGEVTLFAFADGFDPIRMTRPPEIFQDLDLFMPRPLTSQTLVLSYSASPPVDGKISVSGTITHADDPVCALILANGKHMFSCDDNLGTFNLEDVPLDGNGKTRLFAFASGFPPLIKEF